MFLKQWHPFWVKSNQKLCSTKQIKAAGKWWGAHDYTSPPAPEPQDSAVGPSHYSLKTLDPSDFDARKGGVWGAGSPLGPQQDSPLPNFAQRVPLLPEKCPRLQCQLGSLLLCVNSDTPPILVPNSHIPRAILPSVYHRTTHGVSSSCYGELSGSSAPDDVFLEDRAYGFTRLFSS